MTAPDTLFGDQAWPAVAELGGPAPVDQAPAGGVTASPPAPQTAGQTPAEVDESAEVVGSRRPGPVRPRPSAANPTAGPPRQAVRPDKAAETSPGAPAGHDVCRSTRCGMKIRWARTVDGERMPVDYAPDPLGNLVWTMKSRGDWRLREIAAGEQVDPKLKRWTSHFATCPEATRFRRRGTRPAPAPAAPPAPAPPVLEVVPSAPRRLLVVDGDSLFHRAYHAYEKAGLRHPDGRAWWAIYGFVALLVGVIDRVGPDAVLVGFDDHEASARRDRYPDYKAGRPDRAEDLYAQRELLPDLLAELGVATMTPPALEADDVLASAASAAEAAGWRCTIATSDKDAFSLVTESTTVLRLLNGLDNADTMTPAAIEAKFGVTPAQYRDYCALVGDKSDNLPGVAGIGPVKAALLLRECGTLDAALADPGAAVAAIGKAYAGKLTAEGAAEIIARNRDLMAQVNYLPFDPETAQPYATGGAIARVLRAWHLPSLIDRAVATLAAPDITGARLVPVPAPAPSSPAVPGRVDRNAIAPPLEQLAAEQAEADRTCVVCEAVCAARVPVAGGLGESVLLTGVALLGDVVLVKLAGGWVAERVAGYAGKVDNRRTVHRCPVYPGRCVTPGHSDRPAHMYPGGWFCDRCIANRGKKTGNDT